jgi:hydroxyacylglutathione hydrolase
MIIRHFYTPGLCINSYLIFDEEEKKGAIVDPTRQIEMYLALAVKEGIEITDILETHVHADFVSGALELKMALAGKPVIHCSGLGGKEWIPSYADHIVQNHDTFHIGMLRFESLHTPGHTPEHISWIVYDEGRSTVFPELIFSGDLLFVGSIGRPDLLGADEEEVLSKQLYRSLFDVLHALPDFIEIYPSHGSGSLCGKEISKKLSSTLGYEKRCNPWMIPQDYRKWHESLHLEGMPIPKYFNWMKQINVSGPALLAQKKAAPILTPEEFAKEFQKELVIDLRRPDDFAAGNIKGSLNFPFAPFLPLWAGSLVPYDRDLILVVDRVETIFPIIRILNLVGLDRIKGVVDVSRWSFSDKKKLFVPSPAISVEELSVEKDKLFLVDVRHHHEWNGGHIEGAHHIELIRFPEALKEMPMDKTIAVICHSGNRASIVASLIEKEKGGKVFNVRGGMQAWEKAKLPVEKQTSLECSC